MDEPFTENDEPSLEELINDQPGRRVMERDHVDPAALRLLLRAMAGAVEERQQ